MTDQTIPADKVREVIEHFERKRVEVDNLEAINLLRNLKKELLPPPQPTSGLFGKWAKHQEHGDVMCIWGKPDSSGHISVHWAKKGGFNDVEGRLVLLSELTFPHQATRPEDVPAGEAWLVDVNARELSLKSALAIKDSKDTWLTLEGATRVTLCSNGMITLLAPLAPERPVSDLQVKSTERALDRMTAKYREAQERIKALEQANTPRTASTVEEYATLPEGSQVQEKSGSSVWQRSRDGLWRAGRDECGYKLHDNITRTVLRYGWGDEQTAWRIEHDHEKLRVGDYIIDYVDDYGTVENIAETGTRYTDGNALGKQRFAPFIVFPNRDAATPEAIEEAKQARDKETGE